MPLNKLLFEPGTHLIVDVRIICTGDGCEMELVEHFEFSVPPVSDGCQAPTNISVQYLNGWRKISWDGPATGNGHYNIQIVYSNGTVETDNNWYYNSLGAARARPCYTVRVQAICGCSQPTTLSDWAEQWICPPCEPAVEMHVLYLCSDYAGIEYTGSLNGLEYGVRYWDVNNPGIVYTIPNVPNFDPVFDLLNLQPSTTYRVELTALCDQGVTSSSIYLGIHH